jgi:long-chain acyl-CoA synthetase
VTCPGLTVNRRDEARPGTVGKAFRRCVLRVAPDGELLKTSGGKYVAPLKIEAQLKRHKIVQEAVGGGDGHNYCTALFALDSEMLAASRRRASTRS